MDCRRSCDSDRPRPVSYLLERLRLQMQLAVLCLISLKFARNTRQNRGEDRRTVPVC